MSGDHQRRAFVESGPKKLSQLPELSEKFVETVGIIFDATGLYKTNRSYDYVVKLRIFDDSLDPALALKQDHEPYLMVFLYFQNREDTVRIPRIGDIIVLQNFFITLNEYKDKIYVTASSNQSCSDWQVLDGAENASNVPILEKRNVQNRKYHYDELHRIKELRAFRRSYFANHGLQKMCWHRPPLPTNIDKYQIVQMKDVDVLARLVTEFKIEVKGVVYQRLLFRDADSNSYFCEIKSDSLRLEKDRVYKLRSFSVTEEKGGRLKKLTHYEHSAILQLPDSSYDVKTIAEKTEGFSYPVDRLETQFVSELNLDSYDKVTLGGVSVYYGSENEEAELIRGLVNHYPSLEDYNLDDVHILILPSDKPKRRRICSVIKKQHQHLPLTPMSELQAIQVACHLKRSRSEGHIGKRFRVRVNLRLRLEKSSATDIFQLQLTETGETFKLNKFDDAKKALDASFKKEVVLKKDTARSKNKKPPRQRAQELVLYMHMPFMASDKSCKEGVLVYLVTDDGKSQDVFELWNLFSGFSDIQKFVENGETYRTKLVEQFEVLGQSDSQFDLVLEFMDFTDSEPHFRIIDTKFWLLT